MQKEYSVYRRLTTARVLEKEKEDCEVSYTWPPTILKVAI